MYDSYPCGPLSTSVLAGETPTESSPSCSRRDRTARSHSREGGLRSSKTPGLHLVVKILKEIEYNVETESFVRPLTIEQQSAIIYFMLRYPLDHLSSIQHIEENSFVYALHTTSSLELCRNIKNSFWSFLDNSQENNWSFFF